LSGFVLDASVTLGWAFRDEASEAGFALLEALRTETAHVPAIWPAEIANVLLQAERRRRLNPAEVARFCTLLEGLPITVAPATPPPAGLIALARRHGLTAYDAAYLDLALRRAVPLATRDATLARAAQEAGVARRG
jgi:predicted nucleic acid-binding protein